MGSQGESANEAEEDEQEGHEDDGGQDDEGEVGPSKRWQAEEEAGAAREEGRAMKLRPLNDIVMVQRKPKEERSAGGIVIPENAQEKTTTGIVMAVGPGAVDDRGERRAIDVRVGDEILFGRYAGTEVQISGEDFVMLRETEIFGVVGTKQ